MTWLGLIAIVALSVVVGVVFAELAWRRWR
jgi:hypothetical protein